MLRHGFINDFPIGPVKNASPMQINAIYMQIISNPKYFLGIF